MKPSEGTHLRASESLDILSERKERLSGGFQRVLHSWKSQHMEGPFKDGKDSRTVSPGSVWPAHLVGFQQFSDVMPGAQLLPSLPFFQNSNTLKCHQFKMPFHLKWKECFLSQAVWNQSPQFQAEQELHWLAERTPGGALAWRLYCCTTYEFAPQRSPSSTSHC